MIMMMMTKMISLTGLAMLFTCSIGPASSEASVVLQPGYPGYKQPKFSFSPRSGDGRSLFYRESPGVEKYRSPVHELYMRPYNYDSFAHHAVAVLKNDKISGVVNFSQRTPSGPVSVRGRVSGLTAGLHGFHVHQLGDTQAGCKSMKGHFNPLQLSHGAPGDTYRHVGDLGNIMADQDGVAIIDMEDNLLSLTGINSILARGLVIHAGVDDMGKGGDAGSLKTGNAGSRVACAVIALSDGPQV